MYFISGFKTKICITREVNFKIYAFFKQVSRHYLRQSICILILEQPINASIDVVACAPNTHLVSNSEISMNADF